MKVLTKSHLMAHRQCPKRLWLQIHRQDLLEQEGSDQYRTQGERLTEIARSQYRRGVLVDAQTSDDAVQQTQSLLARSQRPLFEAAFRYKGVLVRADLLLPGKAGYRLVEVKSATNIKDYHIDDAAIQAWVIEQAGVPLKSTHIACIDKHFVYDGDGDYRDLLKKQSVAQEIADLKTQIPQWVTAAKRTIKGDEPDIDASVQCHQPFECPFQHYCSPADDQGTNYPPMILPGAGGKNLARKLMEKGYEDLREVPESCVDNPLFQRIVRTCKSGEAELDAAAGDSLRKMSYPRYYLDFESINPAIPIWPHTSPYEQIVFQWSCHVESRDGSIRHYEYLADGTTDPRRELAESMLKVLRKRGPVFVYNASFEMRMIRNMAACLPELSDALHAINDRIVDLLTLARAHYYHPAMMGSWSIKKVIPTIAPELNYDDMDVGGGDMAMQAYSEILQQDTSEQKRQQLREALLAYCERDTLAMVELAHYFQRGV